MDLAVVALVSGGLFGGTYALIGLGLVLAFRATGTLSFAQGQLMLISAYVVAAWQAQTPGSFGAPLFAAIVVAAGASILFYFLVLQKTVGLPHFVGFVATLGFAAFLDGLMGYLFTGSQYLVEIPGLPPGVVTIFGARVSSPVLVLAIFTLALSLLVAGTLRYTSLGVQVRAAGQDAVLASQGGIPVRWVYALSWGVAGVLAAVAGVAFGSTAVIGPELVHILLAAFPVVLLGGLDSVEGAIVGGIVIGVLQGFVAAYLGSNYLDVVTYSVLLGVILLRPQGLFGTRVVVRA